MVGLNIFHTRVKHVVSEGAHCRSVDTGDAQLLFCFTFHDVRPPLKKTLISWNIIAANISTDNIPQDNVSLVYIPRAIPPGQYPPWIFWILSGGILTRGYCQ